MKTYKPASPYIWRVVNIAPQPAAAAFDRCLAESAVLAADRKGRPSLETGGGRLRFDGSPRRLESPRRDASWPLRRVTGVLSAPQGYRVRVEMEVMPWSDDFTEIGLRPRHRWPPRIRSTRPYYRHGVSALNRLCTQMTEWAAAAEDYAFPEAS